MTSSAPGFEARMRIALRQGGGTVAQLADRTWMSRERARRVLAALAEAGEVEQWKRPGTRARIWRLAPQEQP